jgi:hypothetical protein
LHTTLIEAVEAVQQPGSSPGPEAVAEMALYMQLCMHLFERIQTYDASYAPLAASLLASHAALTDHPDRARWLVLRDTLGQVSNSLEAAHARLTDRRDRLQHAYETQFDSVTFETIVLVLAGLSIFSIAAHGFLGRLVADIASIEQRVRGLAAGPVAPRAAPEGAYPPTARGRLTPTAPWLRSAELGALGDAVELLATRPDKKADFADSMS